MGQQAVTASTAGEVDIENDIIVDENSDSRLENPATGSIHPSF